MKIAKALMISAGMLLAVSAKAQFVGGGGSEESMKNSKSVSDSPWRNRFYWYVGPAMPFGTWHKDVNVNGTFSDMYSGNEGFGTKRGIQSQMGGLFYLKKLALPENMGVAINWCFFEYSRNKVDLSPIGASSQVEYVTNFNLFSNRFGAQYSYSITSGLVADAYFTIAPTIGFVPDISSDYYSSSHLYYYSVTPTATYGNLKNFGFDIRYHAFTIGLDFKVGALKGTVDTYVRDNFTDAVIYDATTSIFIRPNQMILRLGFTL